MTCGSNDIKELLPLYRSRELDEPERKLVEEHLRSCRDCRTELSLLEMMAEEAVPDPGEAFWAAMPERIEREVRLQKMKRPFSFPGLLNALFIPRWAWATGAAALLALCLWLLVRPAPVEIAGTDTEVREGMAGLEDMASGDAISVGELSSSELRAASQWAQNEFESIRESIGESGENTGRNVSDELSTLSPRQLDRIEEMLKKKEQDMKNKQRKKSKDEQGLG